MIPKEHLEAMGFVEIAPGLFMKDMGSGIQIFRDYRHLTKLSYAYKNKQKLPIELFQELKAIEKIEKHVMAATLNAFC